MLIEKNNIYNLDCIEGMKNMDENSVDLIITSPPYNAGMDYGNEYNDNRPFNEYISFLRDVFTECYKVLKDGGRIAVNVANTGRKPYIPLASYINIMMVEIGFLHRGEIIWDKGASVGSSCAWGSWCSPSNPSLRDVHEYILIFSKGEYKHKGDKEKITLVGEEFTELTKSIWKMKTASAKKLNHPAPFPIELPEKIIRLYSFKDDLVLDPFMGSGTTAVASINNERNYIGFELNKEYCGNANERVAISSGRMKQEVENETNHSFSQISTYGEE